MKKKRIIWYKGFFMIIVLTMAIFSRDFVSADEESCTYCGMKKAMFGHSWMNIEWMNGQSVGVCSVHCAAINMALNMNNPAKKISVGDYNSKKQIDAEKAYWVLGGDQMGVMTSRAKWAFENKENADNFISKHGGQLVNFEEIMKAAFEDMYEDTLMIQKKRKMLHMKKEKSSS